MQQFGGYLFFNGNSEQAIAFYQRAIDAELLMKMRFSEAPPEECAAVSHYPPEQIMHASLKVPGGMLMLCDGAQEGDAGFSGFSLSLATDSLPQGERWFNALAEGGKVIMPFGKTFWALGFGMLTDKFGVPWMVNVEASPEPTL
ncbi:VOC family protein [Salmonella enterica subsp. enterica serovar Choleraesuis]|nr:VOC family protein [Salmonella enterica subsp. enterica serovar Choleraesuis]